jgi:hypothetical protein
LPSTFIAGSTVRSSSIPKKSDPMPMRWSWS